MSIIYVFLQFFFGTGILFLIWMAFNMYCFSYCSEIGHTSLKGLFSFLIFRIGSSISFSIFTVLFPCRFFPVVVDYSKTIFFIYFDHYQKFSLLSVIILSFTFLERPFWSSYVSSLNFISNCILKRIPLFACIDLLAIFPWIINFFCYCYQNFSLFLPYLVH